MGPWGLVKARKIAWKVSSKPNTINTAEAANAAMMGRTNT
jgi:hypothetical protein